MKWKTERHSQESQQNPRKALMKSDGNDRNIATQVEAKDTQAETIIPTEIIIILVVLIAETMNSKTTSVLVFISM